MYLTSVGNWNIVTRRKEILTWLSSMKYINHHREIQKGLVENTGEWLFDHPDFLEWERSQESRVLWLHGIRMYTQLNSISR
jgi:hypothetical protein